MHASVYLMRNAATICSPCYCASTESVQEAIAAAVAYKASEKDFVAEALALLAQ